MTGADLANVINEAALLTARENGTVITGAALEEAVDRVIGGPRRKGRIISEQEKKITAYHEGGHTLAAWAMPDIDPVYKVTILARGRTGGHAVAVPEEDKGLRTRSEMIAQLVFAMGGRAAEELVFREPTTGAVSDIEQATKIARAMVTEFGMSSKLGAVKYGTEHGDPFLGRTMGNQADYSHEVARDIDDEVRKLIEAAHTEAWEILTEYRDVLDTLAGELLEKETLHRPELEAIFADVEKRPRLTMFDDFGGRIPSDKPPIKTPGELAIERGEPWPPPVPEPAFKAAIAQASEAAEAAQSRGRPRPPTAPTVLTAVKRADPSTGPTQPDYGAPAGWHAPGWPPQQQQPGYWYPPAASPQPMAAAGRGHPGTGPAGQHRQPARRIRRIRRPVTRPDAGKSPDAGRRREPVQPAGPRLTNGGFDGAAEFPHRDSAHTACSTSHVPRPRSASCCTRSARTRTGTVCRTPRPASPAPTARCSPGSTPTPTSVLNTTFDEAARRAGDRQGDPAVLHLRTSPGVVPRCGPRRLHPR